MIEGLEGNSGTLTAMRLSLVALAFLFTSPASAGASGCVPTLPAWVTSRWQRKKVEMLFAHLKRILRLDRLRLRGPNGACDEFHLAAAAQNLRKLAKLIPMPMQPVPA